MFIPSLILIFIFIVFDTRHSTKSLIVIWISARWQRNIAEECAKLTLVLESRTGKSSLMYVSYLWLLFGCLPDYIYTTGMCYTGARIKNWKIQFDVCLCMCVSITFDSQLSATEVTISEKTIPKPWQLELEYELSAQKRQNTLNPKMGKASGEDYFLTEAEVNFTNFIPCVLNLNGQKVCLCAIYWSSTNCSWSGSPIQLGQGNDHIHHHFISISNSCCCSSVTKSVKWRYLGNQAWYHRSASVKTTWKNSE